MENKCKHCEGRGYVLIRLKNQFLNDLYGGNDWANDYAVPCEYCHGWKYVTREEADKKMRGDK